MARDNQETQGFVRSRPRRILRWTGRLLGGLFVLGLLVLVTAFVLQEAWVWRERRNHPAQGKLVDVGGHRLHLYCTGTGTPTVILESAHGGTWMDWALVQPEVAKFTRVWTGGSQR